MTGIAAMATSGIMAVSHMAGKVVAVFLRTGIPKGPSFRLELSVKDYIAILESLSTTGTEIGYIRFLPFCDCSEREGDVQLLTSEKTAMERLQLGDDGTMDTVLIDSLTGKEYRGTYMPDGADCSVCEEEDCENEDHWEANYNAYVEWLMETVAEELPPVVRYLMIDGDPAPFAHFPETPSGDMETTFRLAGQYGSYGTAEPAIIDGAKDAPISPDLLDLHKHLLSSYEGSEYEDEDPGIIPQTKDGESRDVQGEWDNLDDCQWPECTGRHSANRPKAIKEVRTVGERGQVETFMVCEDCYEQIVDYHHNYGHDWPEDIQEEITH